MLKILMATLCHKLKNQVNLTKLRVNLLLNQYQRLTVRAIGTDYFKIVARSLLVILRQHLKINSLNVLNINAFPTPKTLFLLKT
jgi:hypothetical protein